jgi:hypothetical protein
MYLSLDQGDDLLDEGLDDLFGLDVGFRYGLGAYLWNDGAGIIVYWAANVVDCSSMLVPETVSAEPFSGDRV